MFVHETRPTRQCCAILCTRSRHLFPGSRLRHDETTFLSRPPRKPGRSCRGFFLSLSKGAACDPNACAFSNNDVASVRFLLLVAFSCQPCFARSVSSILSNNRISEASTREDQSDTPTMSLTQRNGYHERWLFIHSPIHPCFRIAPPRSICTVWARRSW